MRRKLSPHGLFARYKDMLKKVFTLQPENGAIALLRR